MMLCPYLLWACGSGSSDGSKPGSGALSFRISYFNTKADFVAPAAVIDCAGQGIDTVEAAVYKMSNALLAEGGPWDCGLGQGVISSVPAGSDLKIVVLGRNSEGRVAFRGLKSGLKVTAGANNDAGIIDCHTFSPILLAPVDGSTVHPNTMKLAWSNVAGASEYQIIVSENSDLTNPLIDSITDSINFLPLGLADTRTYFWQVSARDASANTGVGSQIWSFCADEGHINIEPTVQITAPAAGSTFSTADLITFSGSANDSEDGTLGGKALAWRSDVSGFIGEGQSFSSTLLDVGTHQITLTAIDSEGGVGTDSVTITVNETPAIAWKFIAAGSTYTMAIKTDGTLWAWGGNEDYQLGLGDTQSRTKPTQVGGDNDWKSVVAGDHHTLAIKTNGQLWVWGLNNHGQLGLGDTQDETTPSLLGKDWSSAATGEYHTVAITTNGELWTWGNNEYGQLGYGDPLETSEEQCSPRKIGTAKDWAFVAADQYLTVAIKTNGEFWYCGQGEYMEINNFLTQVGSDTDWVSATMGYIFTLALKTNGELSAWGENSFGQLGLGGEPAEYGSGIVWQAPDEGEMVACSDSHTAAIKTNGQLWTWGSNSYGQLGIGNKISQTSPVRVGTASEWVSVTAGDYHTAAINADGELWVWGRNGAGQLGLGDNIERVSPSQVSADTN